MHLKLLNGLGLTDEKALVRAIGRNNTIMPNSTAYVLLSVVIVIKRKWSGAGESERGAGRGEA